MLIVHINKAYNSINWIDKQFKLPVSMMIVEDFPNIDIIKGDWIGVNTGGRIVFAGQFLESKRIRSSDRYRIYLKHLVGFKPIKDKMTTSFKYTSIRLRNVNGMKSIKIGDIRRKISNTIEVEEE